MRSVVERILTRYGTDVTITGETGSRKTRGFFRAVNAKSWQSIEREATRLGEITRGQYIYLGPVEAKVQEGDTLTLGEKRYLFRRVEDYYYGNQPLYQWGLCVERGVNDTWGTQS